MNTNLHYMDLVESNKSPKHSFDEFSPTHEGMSDAGIRLNGSVVVVDFDQHKSVADAMYNHYPTLYVETTRGAHLYYRKPSDIFIKNWTGKITSIGVPVDYKTGSKSLAVIKKDGKVRPTKNDHLLGEWDKLPLLPLELWPSKMKESLYGLGDGDGRNSALYAHLLAVREMYEDKNNLDSSHIRDLLGTINTHVLHDSLPDDESEKLHDSIMDKEIKEEKFLNPKDPIMTSEVLTERLDVHLYNGLLYFWDGMRYSRDELDLRRTIRQHIKLKQAQQKEVTYLMEETSNLISMNETLPVAFNNGYILDDGEIIPVDQTFTPYFIDVAYDPDAYSETVDQFIDFVTCNDRELRSYLEQILGHILMQDDRPQHAFFFTGTKGNNGKSTFLRMLLSFMHGNHSVLDLEDMKDDRKTPMLVGSLVNLADDIDATYLEHSKEFKTLTSGETLTGRPMYKSPIEIKSKATLIFTCNEMPSFKDKSGGMSRRIRVFPFNADIKTVDPKMAQKLTTKDAQSYLLNLALRGLESIEANGGKMFRNSTVDHLTERYLTESDSVRQYVKEFEDDFEGNKTDNVYFQYAQFCDDIGFMPVNKLTFGKRMAAIGYEKKRVRAKGERTYVYEKAE